MPNSNSLPESPLLDEACRTAGAYLDAGQPGAAEAVLRAVLHAAPQHPLANYYFGLFLLQSHPASAALPYLLAALEVSPETSSYWLTYVDTLIRAEQMENAREVLALGKSYGLEGDAVDLLSARLQLAQSAPKIKTAAKKRKQPDAAEEAVLISFLEHGRFTEAIVLASAMTAEFPRHGFGWKMLGALLRSQGDSAGALVPMQKSVQLSPRDAQAQTNLGLVLNDLGRLKESVACHRRALAILPSFDEAHVNLGSAFLSQNRLTEAEVCYRQAVALNPNYAGAYSNLGISLFRQRRFVEAEAAYLEALRIFPEYAEAYNNLGNTLKAQSRLDEAETQFLRAIGIKPDFADAHYNLGCMGFECGNLQDAIAHFKQSLIFKPDFAKAHLNLSAVFFEMGQFGEAKKCAQKALEVDPSFAEAYANLANAESGLGEIEHAVSSYKKALEKNSGNAAAYSNYLLAISRSSALDPAAFFAEHCRFGDQFEAPLRDLWPQHTNTRDPERCLKIGFVSADLYLHAVANFIEPIWANLAGLSSIAIHVYYNRIHEDSVSERLRSYVSCWHGVAMLSDTELAEKILNDRIDILIDLSGHTGRNRLLAFARKPAPVQASWIGYPGSTGLRAMDYYFADRYYLPPGQFDDQFTEKLAYLPASAPFLPYEAAPPINDLPALNAGYLTFGSFGSPSKLSESTIALWSQLLRALPESRMLLGAMAQEREYEKLIHAFAQEGIARERLRFYPRSDMLSYLTLHHQVDICLDTYPYTGGTTTFHALWMGVPTLTVTGSTPAGRSGASILAHVGLDAFVASDASDFVQRGKVWAGNQRELADLRACLRARCKQSPTRSPELLAASFERALRIMWQRWCSELPAESFEVLPQDVHAAQGGAE